MREPEENSKELSEKGSKLTEESTQAEETGNTQAEESTQAEETGKQPLSETWSQDAQDELQEFIELQGIYIRQ